MKNLNAQDERVAAQRRKINSEAYGLLMVALLISALVQQFLLNAPLEQYAIEMMYFFAASVYMIARHMTLGIDMFGSGKRAKVLPFVNMIVTAAVVTAVNGVLNYSKYGEHYQKDGMGFFIATLAITFISAAAAAFAVLSFMNYLNGRRQAQIQKRLDEDEAGEV